MYNDGDIDTGVRAILLATLTYNYVQANKELNESNSTPMNLPVFQLKHLTINTIYVISKQTRILSFLKELADVFDI